MRLMFFLLLFPVSVFAQDWEYKVVSTPFNVPLNEGVDYVKTDTGMNDMVYMTKIINMYAKDKWDVVSVVGNPGLQIIYLKRKIK